MSWYPQVKNLTTWALIAWILLICSGFSFVLSLFQLAEFIASHQWKIRGFPIFPQYVDGYFLMTVFSGIWVWRYSTPLDIED